MTSESTAGEWVASSAVSRNGKTVSGVFRARGMNPGRQIVSVFACRQVSAGSVSAFDASRPAASS